MIDILYKIFDARGEVWEYADLPRRRPAAAKAVCADHRHE